MATSGGEVAIANTAAYRTLNIYELLENIILHLPPTDVTRVMRVATSWNTLIKNSTRLQEARVATPISPVKQVPHGLAKQRPDEWAFIREFAPEYDASLGVVMRIPSWTPMIKAPFTCGYYSTFQAKYNTDSKDAWVTLPPCQSMLIRMSTGRDERWYTLGVNTGIRIRDLLDVQSFKSDKLLPSTRQEDLNAQECYSNMDVFLTIHSAEEATTG